jgi:membrane associated rhomboid family serine protease
MLDPYRHASILAIIIVAAVVFALEQTKATSFAEDYGAIPALIAGAGRQIVAGDFSLAAIRQLSRLLSAMFVHGDAQHLIYNMVFLWTFGYLASQVLGQWTALVIFFLCGICGNIVQVGLNLDSPVPIIGASGAIAGLAGAYFALALGWQLPWPDVWPLAHPIPPLQLGAVAVIGFVGDIYLLANHHDQHIAYGAHIGGFMCGLAIAAVTTTVYPTRSAYERGRRIR